MTTFEIPLAQAADMVSRSTRPLTAVIRYTHLPEKIRRQLIDQERRGQQLANQINAYERKIRNGC